MKMDIGEETRIRAIDADGRRLAWRSVGAGPPLMPGGGHAFEAQEPERLAAMIREFVLG